LRVEESLFVIGIRAANQSERFALFLGDRAEWQTLPT